MDFEDAIVKRLKEGLDKPLRPGNPEDFSLEDQIIEAIETGEKPVDLTRYSPELAQKGLDRISLSRATGDSIGSLRSLYPTPLSPEKESKDREVVLNPVECLSAFQTLQAEEPSLAARLVDRNVGRMRILLSPENRRKARRKKGVLIRLTPYDDRKQNPLDLEALQQYIDERTKGKDTKREFLSLLLNLRIEPTILASAFSGGRSERNKVQKITEMTCGAIYSQVKKIFNSTRFSERS